MSTPGREVPGTGPISAIGDARHTRPRHARRTARWLRPIAWSLCFALIALAVISCVIRVAWFHTVSHPAGETSTDVTVERGSLMLGRFEQPANASPTTIRRSVLNRQIEIGFRARLAFSHGPSRVEAQFPLAIVCLGLSGAIITALVWRRIFAAPVAGQCPCGYSLAGLGPAAQCPECGREVPPST